MFIIPLALRKCPLDPRGQSFASVELFILSPRKQNKEKKVSHWGSRNPHPPIVICLLISRKKVNFPSTFFSTKNKATKNVGNFILILRSEVCPP